MRVPNVHVRAVSSDCRKSPNDAQASDELFSVLQAHAKQRTLKDAYQVGQAIVSYLYGDSAARRKRPKYDPKYIELVTASELPISKSELYRAIRVFEVGRRYPELLADDALTLSHVLSVLSLQADEQVKLLRLAREHRWTVRQLRATVSKTVECSDAVPSGTGRPRVPPVMKTLRGPLADESAFDGIEELLAVDEVTAQGLIHVCQKTRSALDKVEDTLRVVGEVGREERVMVVDGSGAFTGRAQRELRKHVRSVRVANSCAETRVRIDEHISCLAISLQLPDGCGHALAEHLQIQYPCLKCIYLTRVPRSELPDTLKDAHPLVTLTSGLRLLATLVLEALHEKNRVRVPVVHVAQPAARDRDPNL